MKIKFSNFFAISLLLVTVGVYASPEEDRELFHDHFEKLFPNTEYSDYKNGVYSIDSSSREPTVRARKLVFLGSESPCCCYHAINESTRC